MKLPPRTLTVIRNEKVSPEGPPCKYALQDMEFYDKFVDRLRDSSKVKNPAVS